MRIGTGIFEFQYPNKNDPTTAIAVVFRGKMKEKFSIESLSPRKRWVGFPTKPVKVGEFWECEVYLVPSRPGILRLKPIRQYKRNELPVKTYEFYRNIPYCNIVYDTIQLCYDKVKCPVSLSFEERDFYGTKSIVLIAKTEYPTTHSWVVSSDYYDEFGVPADMQEKADKYNEEFIKKFWHK